MLLVIRFDWFDKFIYPLPFYLFCSNCTPATAVSPAPIPTHVLDIHFTMQPQIL